MCFYDSYQGTAAADYLNDNQLATEVGVFYQSDNDYSAGLYNAFVAECAKTGVTIKETQTFTTATNTDFSTQVNALVNAGVKVVFIPIYAEEASTFLTQAKGKFAEDVYFFGADGLDRRRQHQQGRQRHPLQGRCGHAVRPKRSINQLSFYLPHIADRPPGFAPGGRDRRNADDAKE